MSKAPIIIDATESQATAVAPALRNADDRLNITLHQVKDATADLDEPSSRAILWLFHTAKRESWNRRQIASHLGLSETTIYRVFTGKYEGSLANVCADIERFRKIYDERQSMRSPDFIETSLTNRIFQACDFALISQSVVFIWGENQIGKTRALEEYQRRNNHGQTIYVRMPAASGILMVAQEIAKAIGLSPKGCYTKLRQAILKSIDDKNNLICDEMHQVFLTYQSGSALKVLEFLREIHDRTKCGLVLCGTNVWRDEIESGPQKKVLAQLRNRGVAHVQLEDKPLAADLAKFFRHYHLAEPTGRAATIVADVVHNHGLGRLCKLFQAASRRASKLSEPLDWSGFTRTYDTLNALSASTRK